MEPSRALFPLATGPQWPGRGQEASPPFPQACHPTSWCWGTPRECSFGAWRRPPTSHLLNTPWSSQPGARTAAMHLLYGPCREQKVPATHSSLPTTTPANAQSLAWAEGCSGLVGGWGASLGRGGLRTALSLVLGGGVRQGPPSPPPSTVPSDFTFKAQIQRQNY